MPNVFSSPIKSQDAWEALIALKDAHPSPRSPRTEAMLDDAALDYFDNIEFLEEEGSPPKTNLDYGQRSNTWLEFLSHFPSATFYKKRIEDFFAWYEAEVDQNLPSHRGWLKTNFLVQYFDEKR